MESKTVLIQKNLLVDLKLKIITYNEQLKITNSTKSKKDKKSKLKLDVFVQILSLFNSMPCKYWGDEKIELHGVVRLNAERLKKMYHDEYNRYLVFLIENKFIELVSNYNTNTNKSRAYKINSSYAINKQTGYKIEDKTLLKKMRNNTFTKEAEENKKFCKYKRPHLVKCFNDNFTINKEAVFKEIEPLRIHKNTYSKYSSCLNYTLDIEARYFKYSIEPKTDNRLHTTLSLCNKIIRKHIYYKGENIVGLDVKTSQPYFLCAVLKAILMKNKSLLDKINATKIFDDKIIFKLFHLEIDVNEIEGFIISVLDHQQDFYEAFSKKLTIKYNDENLPYRKIFIPKKKRKLTKETHKIVPYKNERELAKKVINEIFNSSPQTPITEASVFRKEYPSISAIMKCIKDYGIEMWRLLSFIEAYCLLDYSAFKLAEKYQDIFITSIHDCLVTTECNVGLFEKEITKHLMEVTTLEIPPKFEVENWKDSKVEVAA